MQSLSVVVARGAQRVLDVWYEYQVELHGQYSAARLLDLHAYAQTTRRWRMVVICFATPLLALALIIAVDCIPLASPDAGASANYVFWCRNLLTVAFMTYGPVEQFQQIARMAAFSSKQIAVVAVIASVTGVGFQFLLSLAVGFPLPFSLACGLPIWMLVLFVAFVVVHFGGVTVRATRTNCVHPATALSPRGAAPAAQNHDLVHERIEAIAKYARVFACQASLVFVYPAYIYVFQALGPVAQTFFVLVLPLIKIAVKNCLCYLLGALDDIKPEFVIINIEVFHAFYVSCCMQSALSPATTLCLTLLDWSQAWLSIHDVRIMAVDIKRLLHKIPHEHSLQGRSCLEITQLILDEDPAVRRHSSFAASSAHGTILLHSSARRRTAIAPITTDVQTVTVLTCTPSSPHALAPLATTALPHTQPLPCVKDVNTLTEVYDAVALRLPVGQRRATALASLNGVFSDAERLAFAQKTAQLLFTTEFLILIEFTEVIVPVMYGATRNAVA